MDIPIIDNPPFVVHFEKTVQIEPKIIKTTKETALEALKFFAHALADSTMLTLRASGRYFKYIVFNYNGDWKNVRIWSSLPLFMFKVVYFAGIVSATFFLTLAKKLFSGQNEHQEILKWYGGGEINLEHLRCTELNIDTSNVPDTIKVDDLAQILADINFVDPENLFYMSPNACKEGNKQYSTEELKTSLDLFIKRVKTREAFIGTPPSHDAVALIAFYQQIEDAVRVILHKVNQDIADFKAENGDDIEEYNEIQKKRLRDLSETRSRFAIDLAIAGNHCGARYMGDVMESYYLLSGESYSKSFEDNLIDILAYKRLNIARQHIATHLGQDTHSYSQYMATFGAMLGIPGTKNVVEHLAGKLDQEKYLKLFFTEYTVNEIIDTIQAKLKEPKAQGFRSSLFDWLKDQANDWNQEPYTAGKDSLLARLEPIFAQQDNSEPPQWETIDLYTKLVKCAKDRGEALPAFKNWDDWISEFLALDIIKIEFKQLKQREENQLVARMRFKQEFLKLPSEVMQLIQAFTFDGQDLNRDEIQHHLVALHKKDTVKAEIQKHVNLDSDTIERILEGGTNLSEAIQDKLDQNRRVEFLNRLNLENITTDDISKELIEWIIVSHRILNP